MAIGAHKCVISGCKGYIVFDDADFNFEKIPTVDGFYEFDNPCCSECNKVYSVIPSYSVILIEEDNYKKAKNVCITDFERRKIEIEFENETNPYNKIKMFINMRNYSYSVKDVIDGYLSKQRSEYISYTMTDCVNHLEKELESLV